MWGVFETALRRGSVEESSQRQILDSHVVITPVTFGNGSLTSYCAEPIFDDPAPSSNLRARALDSSNEESRRR